MKLAIKPCTDGDVDFLWEKFGEAFADCSAPVEEGAQEELLVFKVVDAEGAILGGCVLDIDATKIAEFNCLWVDERYRRRGIGTALIREAERVAREKGCREIINAYTFDFQEARPLFEELDYRLIGIAEDWPRGHEGYTLVKELDGAASVCRASFEVIRGSEEDGEAIGAALKASFSPVAPRSHPYIDLDRKLVDGDGTMIAGCIAGISGWDALHIDMVWVDERMRRQAVGSFLLSEVEREAKRNGAYLARTGVLAQRAAFFSKNGFAAYAVHEREPEWLDMQKRL